MESKYVYMLFLFTKSYTGYYENMALIDLPKYVENIAKSEQTHIISIPIIYKYERGFSKTKHILFRAYMKAILNVYYSLRLRFF